MNRPLATTVTLILLACGLAGTAGAEVELTPQVGYRDGRFAFTLPIACVAIVGPCPNAGESRNDRHVGLVADVGVGNGWMLEALINHQATSTRYRDAFSGVPVGIPDAELDVTQLQVGGQRRWPGERFTPFVAVGVGVARYRSPLGELVAGFDDDHLSASGAGGVKVHLTPRVGLRLEGRGYWTALPATMGGDLTQVELGTGLTFAW